ESTRNLERSIEFDPRNFFTLQQIALSYGLLHRYDEDMSVLRRALAVKPEDVDTKIALAAVQFHWKANTQPVRQTVDSIRSTNPSALPNVANDWLSCALAERIFPAQKDSLVPCGNTPRTDDAVHINRPLMEGLMAEIKKDDGKPRAAFPAARGEKEKITQAHPISPPPLCV